MQLGLIAKLMSASALLSIGIKIWIPRLGLPSTNAMALLLVTLPPTGMGLFFLWRFLHQRRLNP
jgi:hypothetical protein